MSRNKQRNLFFTSTGTPENRKVKIPRFIMILLLLIFCCVFVISLAGYSRLARYGYSHAAVLSKQRKNSDLLKKIAFLRKLSEQYEKKMKTFVNFEDNTRLKYGLNVINEDIRLAGIGGPPSLELMLKESFEDPVVLKAGTVEKKAQGLLRQISLQDSTFSRMSSHLSLVKNKWAQFPSVWPAQGRITSTYGMRLHPFMRRMYFHEGLDIANKIWTPVIATADGVISLVGMRGDYGISIMIDHYGGAYTTVYAHLEDVTVEEGQVVRRNECIGYLGNTGRSTGPHLHYEVRQFDKVTNPRYFLLPRDAIIN
jgi:hypothetical protein